jgi:hypothetical protein
MWQEDSAHEGICTSETSVNFQQATRRDNPEGSALYVHVVFFPNFMLQAPVYAMRQRANEHVSILQCTRPL